MRGSLNPVGAPIFAVLQDRKELREFLDSLAQKGFKPSQLVYISDDAEALRWAKDSGMLTAAVPPMKEARADYTLPQEPTFIMVTRAINYLDGLVQKG